ncbi:T9SS type B sorting domain-containing protein [Chryseobacterium tongliaoense]|uniref:T9SS type B sorting domain-containing protein n=1 Tax=Chryseobacterium tongliaoense TaxID=3240933 RepID=UPI00351838F8
MNIFRLTFVLMLMIINTLSAQRDTEHWIAPYYNSFASDYTNTIFLSTDSTTPFDVEIYSNNTLLTTVTISKGNPQQYTLDVNRIAAKSTGDAFTAINKGVYLKASKPFFCNLRLAQTNHAEIITSKGRAGIGKEFHVATSPNLNDSGNNSSYNFTAGILATEDNTTVTVSWNTTGLVFYGTTSPGNSHTFTLNKGQSFIFAGSGATGFTTNIPNLTGFIGAKVTADKPVSLTNGSVNGNFAASSTALLSATDAILDQSVPLERLGNSFAMVKTRSTDPSLNMEGGLIVATENNTQIFLNGSGTPVQTLNAGQWYRINESNYIAQGAGHSNMYISTSKNVYLYQFIGVGNSSATCGFNYIPPLNCFLPKKIDELGNVNSMPGSGATPSLKLNILTEAGATVTVNGTTPTAAEGPYPLAGSTQWVTYSLDNVTGNLTINSSRALTAGINGGYDNAGYGGYFAGFSSIPIIAKQSGECVPGIVLGVEDGFDNYQWMLNGVDIPGATSNTYTPTQAGNYTLRLQNGSCTAIVTPIYKVFSCLVHTTKNINVCSTQVITPAFTSSTQTPVPGTVTITTPPTNGTAVVNANGTITYTPTATSGTDQIVYRFCGNAPEFIDCEEVTLNITIAPLAVNNATLSACPTSTSPPSATFDLTLANPNISGIGTFTYYENQADAIAGNANTIFSPGAYTSGNATVYVRVTVGGCFKVAELQLNLTQSVVSTITASSTTICYGGSVTLTSGQATGNLWSTTATTSSITVTAPGTYTLTNTSGNCPSTPASITITAEDDPNVQITGNLAFCQGSSTTLTATSAGSGNTYLWSNSTTGATNTVSTPGVYTVTVTTPTGCQYQESVTVTEDVMPTVQNASLSECTNSTTATFNLNSAESAISGTGTFTYYVNQADAIAGNASTISNTTAYISGNATIYVRVTVGTCFKVVELQLNITQTSTPTITASSTTICYGGSVTLTSSQATGNLWSTSATTSSITVTAPGTYTLTNSSGSCPSTPASITITAEDDPNVQITGNLAFCQGSSTTLTASANGSGNTYLWSNNTNVATNTVTTPGVYTVTVTTPAGCQYQKSVTVTEDPVPTVQNASLSECTNGTTATFNLNSAESAISSTQGVNFTYYVNQADAIAGNASTISSPGAYTSGNATIYVRVTLGNCFKIAELQLNLTQTSTPTITASSTTICYGGSVTLTSSQATGNLWSTSATTSSITVTAPGTYTLTNSSGSCPSTPASITITAEDDPNVQITGNLAFCQGSSTTLTASANGSGNTYLWSNNTNVATNTVTTPGVYTVTVTTPAGCQYQKSVTVTEDPVPTVQNASLSECTNGTTATFNLNSAESAISSTQGVNFTYYVNQADAIAGNASTILSPGTYTSGNATIYVRVTLGNCFKIAELQLNLMQTPTPTITASSTTICYGGSVILTSSQTTGNTWSTTDTTQSITVTTPGTYTLTNSSGSCPSNPASITITAEDDPNVQITGNLAFCQGSSTTLTATSSGSGNTYSWSNNTTGATNTVSTPGVYTVTVTTPAGCQYQESVTVVTDPAIIVNIAQPAQITCTNSQVTLDATSSVYQPGATFLWTTTGGGNIVSGANTLTPVVDNNGTYTLTITSNPLGCTSQASVTVIKNITPPAISVTAPTLTICIGQSVTLTASGAVSYTWTGLPGTGNTQTVSPTTTTTYTVTGIGANGCPASTPATITINVLPEIVSSLHDVEICKGDKATLDAGSGPNYTYAWSTGATTQTITTQLAGTYTVTISNGVCSKTFTATVGYLITPEILEIHYKNNTLVIIAKNNGSLPMEYSIDGGVNWQSSNTFNNVFSNTLYMIQVRNKGMTCYTEAMYYTFFMANVITPNNDGKNDYIDFSEISKYGDFTGNIFDRYGKSVFNASSKNPKWDGKHLGYHVPTGTYWYKLSWEDRISKKPVHLSGWILLKNRD